MKELKKLLIDILYNINYSLFTIFLIINIVIDAAAKSYNLLILDYILFIISVFFDIHRFYKNINLK